MKNEKYIRKLRRISTHSYSVILPKELVKKFGWKEKQKVIIEDIGRKRMEIRDWSAKGQGKKK